MKMILTMLLAMLAGSPDGNDKIIEQFQNPTRAARPYVWWHWMDGEVSLEGIKKDLEWMDAVGIAGFHQFDAGGVNMPKAAPFKRPYLSETWKEAFRYAVQKADSLNMEMTIASAPGWSSTGGPWVSPEDAMKKLEWQTIDIQGGQIDIQLPELPKVVGPYRDIPRKAEHIDVEPYGYDVAVVAVKLSNDNRTMEELDAKVTKESADKEGYKTITIEFPRKQQIRAFTLRASAGGFRPREGDAYSKNEIQYSNDGKKWQTLTKVIKSPLDYVTVNASAKARFFRAIGEKLIDLELFTTKKIQQFEEKAGYCFPYDFNKQSFWIAEKFSRNTEVIDLTDKLNPDGTLKCELPNGRWRIYRFGASLTGKMNHPASPNATGLEVDKLNKEAWTRYFQKYLEMYKEAAGGMLGEKGITHLLVDSYEANGETWTPGMEKEFKARRGYDLKPWMPVLAGEIIKSYNESEQFLRDWRKTLAELFEENYNRINEIIAEYGMKGSYIESHETGRAFVGDGMAVKKKATVPMSAIWMQNSPSGSMIPSAISDIRESASVAHIYGQNIAAAESFTANGDGKHAYTYHPGNIKMVADIALASGLNRFVIHDSASQPSDDYLPGLALFRYGQWFHRNETWAPYARVWTDYLARSCQMMQQGRNVADILLYYGEDTNATAQYGGEKLKYLPVIPAGYNFDYANPDVLLNVVRTEGKCLVTGSGQRYKVLVLGGNCRNYVSKEMMGRIEAIKAAGVPVCYEDELAECLKVNGIGPDVDITSQGFIYGGDAPKNQRGHDCSLTGVQFVHREIPGSQVYWFCNFTQKPWEGEIKVRDGGEYSALLNAEDGSAVRLPKGGNAISLKLKAGDAVFVMFTDQPLDIPAAKPEYKEKEILTLDRWWDVEFNQKGGEKATETFSTLNDWTSNSDPVVKYFSGTANYKSAFTIPEGALKDLKEAKLDLGTVYVMAELIINGHNAGVLWREPYVSADILPYLKEGENSIEVNVTNLWVNRMIGDRQRGEKPVTKVRRFYNAGDKLLPSGLLGPVKLIGEN
jgi:hypothetical protein